MIQGGDGICSGNKGRKKLTGGRGKGCHSS